MADIEQYRKKAGELADRKSSGTGGASTDTYQLARDQEYTALLDKEVQLENAKQNAMKYTNNQMASQGFDSTGYGSTQQSAIYGQYMNALGSAQNATQSNISNINLQESEANQESANDRFKSITTMLSTATTKDQMDSLLKDYGYIDDSGNWNEKPESVSDDDWYQMKYYYNLQRDSLQGDSAAPEAVKSAIGGNATGYDVSSLGSLIAGKNDDMTFSTEYAYEYKRLMRMIQSDELDGDGTMIELKRGNDQGEGPKYLYYYKGKFYFTNADRYGSYSGKRYTITDHTSTETTNSAE